MARAENMIDVTQNADVFVEVSGLLKALAVNLGKIAHDLRLMASGPRAGFGEIQLPERQAGSSIMPGKVNPIIPEAVNQVAFHVMAADVAIAMAAQSGQLELNAFLPLVAHHLLGSLEILTNCVHMFNELCIKDIAAVAGRCHDLLEHSLAAVTALVPHIGYDLATEVARTAVKNGKTVRETTIEMGILIAEQLETILNPQAMTRPGIVGAVQKNK